MNILLTPDLEDLINEKLKSGQYNSPSEIIIEGLRLLKEQDQLKELRREELCKEIMKGVDAIRDGKYITLETSEDYRNFAEKIIKEGREGLAEKVNSK